MNTEDKKKHTGTWVFLLITTIVFALLLIPSVYISAFSGMMFDAPGSENNPYLLALFYSIVSFPLLSVLSFSSWFFYVFKQHKTAVIISLLPLLSIVAVLLQIFISFTFFGGNFGPK